MLITFGSTARAASTSRVRIVVESWLSRLSRELRKAYIRNGAGQSWQCSPSIFVSTADPPYFSISCDSLFVSCCRWCGWRKRSQCLRLHDQLRKQSLTFTPLLSLISIHFSHTFDHLDCSLRNDHASTVRQALYPVRSLPRKSLLLIANYLYCTSLLSSMTPGNFWHPFLLFFRHPLWTSQGRDRSCSKRRAAPL